MFCYFSNLKLLWVQLRMKSIVVGMRESVPAEHNFFPCFFYLLISYYKHSLQISIQNTKIRRMSDTHDHTNKWFKRYFYSQETVFGEGNLA